MLQHEKMLVVFAHPDDELIFGWPIMQDRTVPKELLICTSDINNESRKWCRDRKQSLHDMCQNLQISYTCLDHNSGFYQYDSQDGSLKAVVEDIAGAIRKHNFTSIFTHNPYGEYGNLDHVLLFNIVASTVSCPILYTDIKDVVNWPVFDSDLCRELYYQKKVGEFSLNQEWLKENSQFYHDRGNWTWGKPVKTSCGLFVK